jgi:DNA-binding transcriptional ArsR family regulator
MTGRDDSADTVCPGRRESMAAKPPSASKRAQTFESIQMCLASPNRLAILLSLADGPRDVSSLADALDLDLPLMSNHLSVLRRAGLVDFDRKDRFHLYRLGTRVAAGRSATYIKLTIHADDGSRTGLTIPRSAIGISRANQRLRGSFPS